jgi:hypothetical protein
MQAQIGKRSGRYVHDRRIALYLGEVERDKRDLPLSQRIEGAVVVPPTVAELYGQGKGGKDPEQ